MGKREDPWSNPRRTDSPPPPPPNSPSPVRTAVACFDICFQEGCGNIKPPQCESHTGKRRKIGRPFSTFWECRSQCHDSCCRHGCSNQREVKDFYCSQSGPELCFTAEDFVSPTKVLLPGNFHDIPPQMTTLFKNVTWQNWIDTIFSEKDEGPVK